MKENVPGGRNVQAHMRSKKLRYLFCALLILGFACGIAAQCFDIAVPDNISVFGDTDAEEMITAPFVSLKWDNENDPSNGAVSSGTTADADAMLLGIIPLKTVSVSVFDKLSLCPGGMPFGVKLSTDGILVIGVGQVDCEGQNKNPCAEAGIRQGDVITAVNKKAVKGGSEFQDVVKESGGKELLISVLRDGKEYEFKVTPALSSSDDCYKLGLWIKDRAAGIGTVTFYDPENKTFAGLGHGICDAETGLLLPMREGSVFSVRIDGVVRGEAGEPGELKGYFTSGKVGALYANTHYGVFGAVTEAPAGMGEAIPIGLRSDVTEGEAHIRCTVGDAGLSEYSVNISKIDTSSHSTKNFVVEVTDPALLEATGGIVQGMSGSPIIQNGKLVGAVTHVLINDPTKGYGIFIENMLEAAENGIN